MFGARIKELRKRRGFNQKEMGEKVHLSPKRVSYLELERNEPDINTIIAYCQYFNVSADWLIGIIDTEKPLK